MRLHPVRAIHIAGLRGNPTTMRSTWWCVIICWRVVRSVGISRRLSTVSPCAVSPSSSLRAMPMRRSPTSEPNTRMSIPSLLQAGTGWIEEDVVGLEQRALGFLETNEGFEIFGKGIDAVGAFNGQDVLELQGRENGCQPNLQFFLFGLELSLRQSTRNPCGLHPL